MNKEKYLLDCLMEECAEIIKLASKSIRFGLGDRHPHQRKAKINTELLKGELCDLMGVLRKLEECEVYLMPTRFDDSYEKIKAKMVKLDKYMKISREAGHLEGE